MRGNEKKNTKCWASEGPTLLLLFSLALQKLTTTYVALEKKGPFGNA